jgi:hypothetical protein
MTRPIASLNTTRRQRLARATAIVTLVLVVAGGVLIVAVARLGRTDLFDTTTFSGLSLGATYAVVGLLVAWRRPENVIGWVFLTVGLWQAVDTFAGLAATYGVLLVPGSVPAADVLAWIAIWAWVPGFVPLLTFSLLLFPDGHLPSPRWRPVAWLSFVAMALLAIPVALAAWPYRGVALTGSLDEIHGLLDVAGALQFVGLLLLVVLAVASIASIVIRFRRSKGLERQQLRWFTYAAIVEITFFVASAFLQPPSGAGLVAAVVIVPLLPLATGIAILRYRLYDLDRIVSRTIAYALVSGVLLTIFGASILVLTAILATFTQGQTVAVAASTLAVFALFQPVLRRVRRAVDRRFDRARYDADRTAAAFAERLRDEVDIATVTGDLDRTVRGAMRPAVMGLWLRGPGA